MITVLHPELMPIIKEFPGGILPLRNPGNGSYLLILKVPKEWILAAKVSEKLRVYLAPVFLDGVETAAVTMQFPDDDDEPLTVNMLFHHPDLPKIFFGLLRSRSPSVHLFDEHSREHLVYESRIDIPTTTNEQINRFNFIEPTYKLLVSSTEQADHWYGLRGETEELRAVTIELIKSVYGDGLFIQDLNPQNHSYHGSRGFSHTVLEREEPGSLQEEDIIRCLSMCFDQNQIYHTPLRIFDKEEFCDILVITDRRVLIVQAKDSPNVERISKQKLTRKRANVMSALQKGIGQISGAVGYLDRFKEKRLEFFIGDELHKVDVSDKEVKTLIIVKELFSDQYREYSSPLFSLMNEKQVDALALDYPELFAYCDSQRDEEAFFRAYDRVIEVATEREEYPRLRFGLIDHG